MDAAVANRANRKTPLSERINLRMIVVAAVVLFLIGYPVYTFVKASLNGGVERVGDVSKVDLKSLGNFPFNESDGTINDVPKKWRDLDGQKVMLEGFMFVRNSAADEISRFEFVYNVTRCCFNGPPKVQERVYSQTREPIPYYSQQLVRCVGTLHVGVTRNEAGGTNSVFELDVEKVEPL